MYKNDYSGGGGGGAQNHLLYSHSASALESPAIEIIQGIAGYFLNHCFIR
jgi:hypothetical protein